ncbi:hypothetical protein AB0937_34505 [Streptomyces sp. NPDC047880]
MGATAKALANGGGPHGRRYKPAWIEGALESAVRAALEVHTDR